MDIRSLLLIIFIIPAALGIFSLICLIVFSGVLSTLFSWSDSISYFLGNVGTMPYTFFSSIIPYFFQISIISVVIVVFLSASGYTGGFGRDGDGE